MDKLGIAAERLTKALNALEEGLVPLDRTRDDAADVRAQLAECRAKLDAADQERDRLLARVAELEEEQQALTEISEEIENRLDGAIGEIRSALGR
jgi:predicted nuclease with TOPRIM domain